MAVIAHPASMGGYEFDSSQKLSGEYSVWFFIIMPITNYSLVIKGISRMLTPLE
jgi:hypothetical protein